MYRVPQLPDFGLFRCVSLESDLVRDDLRSEIHFVSDALRHRHGGHSPRFGHSDQTIDAVAGLVQKLGDLMIRIAIKF